MNLKKIAQLIEAQDTKKKKELIQSLNDDELTELNKLISSEYKRKLSKRYYRYQVSPTEVQWLVEPFSGRVKNKRFKEYLISLSCNKRAADKNKQSTIYRSKKTVDDKNIISIEDLENEYKESLKSSHSLTQSFPEIINDEIEYTLLPISI